ncbi:MAG TPA: MCE family protein [Candidatus Acidoferrum sp.]|nr:MCE family protein [Candidatus Acidoferrum sp.]
MAEITIRISDRTLKIAGYVLAAICLLWVGQYVWSKGLLLPKYELKIYLPEASGIEKGARVRLDGIDIGTVSAVKLAGSAPNKDRRSELDLRIFKRSQNQIRTDSLAMVETEGFLGNRFINISRGFNGAPVEPGSEIPARAMLVATSNLTELLDRIGTCLKEQKNSSPDPAKPPSK